MSDLLVRSYGDDGAICGAFEHRMLSKGMQSVQDSMQAEYDEMYEHYQVTLYIVPAVLFSCLQVM